MSKSSEKRRVKSVEKAIDLIELVMEIEGGATVSELAEQAGCSVGSIHTYLTTFQEKGIAVQEDKKCHLGPKLVTIGEYVRHHTKFYQASRDEINRLAEETGETAHAVVRHNSRIISIHECYGGDSREREKHEKEKEKPVHFHATAWGKAYLATLPENEVEEILDDVGLPEITPQTITERENFLDELAETRRRGYSINDEEQVIGLRAIGTAVRNQEGRPVGAISLSAPRHRMKRAQFEEELAERVRSAASVIEIQFANIEL